MRTGNRACRVLAGLVVAVGLAGCAGKEERLAEHMNKARALYAQGESEKARVEIKNVLQIDPKLAEAYLLTGMIEEQQANGQRAYANYLKATELEPANLRAAGRLARVYLFANELEKAEATAKSILDRQAEDPVALVVQAGVRARRGEGEAAVELARRAIAKDSTITDAYSVIAGVQAGSGKVADAIATLEQGIALSPAAEDLRLVSIELLVREKRFDDAEKRFDELIRLRPANLAYRASLARLHLTRNDPARAEQVLRDTVKADPSDDQRLSLLLDFLVAQKRSDQAEKEFLAGIEARPDSYRLRFGLAGFYRNLGQTEKLEKTLLAIIDRNKDGPDGVRARSELASLRLAQGKLDETQRLVAEVLAKNPRDNLALQLRGQMALDRGDAVAAIADFRAVRKDQPNSLPVAVLLARAHVANKEPQLAVETLGKLTEAAPNDPALQLALADLKSATGDFKGALESIAVVLNANPKDLRALGAKAEIEVAQKQWRNAEATVAVLRGAYPENPQVHYRAGLVYHAQGKLDQAAAAYEVSLQKRPGAIEPLTQLANIDFARGRGERASERIEKAVAANPRNFLLHALQGRVLARQGKPVLAEAAFRKAVEVAPEVPGTHIELAGFFSGRGDFKAAAVALEAGIKAVPRDPRLRVQLAEVHQRSGDVERAIAEYEIVLKDLPGHDLAANNLASLLLDHRTEKASLDRALELAKRFERSPNPAYADTLGWAYYRHGQFEASIPYLRRAAQAAPDAAVIQYHLGAALLGAGDKTAATAHLQRAVNSPQKFPEKDQARKSLESLQG